jgi:hypothetical protein
MTARASSRRPFFAGYSHALLCAALALAVAGCGDSHRHGAARVRPARPEGFRTLELPSAGVAISVPRNWATARRRAPLLATIASGSAIVALWRHPAQRPPPGNNAQLQLYRIALEHAVDSRGGLERLFGASLERIDGQPAVALDALERLAGATWRVRSIHIYAPGQELVLEERAPPALFAAARAAFARIAASLRVAAVASGTTTTSTSG